MVLHVGYLANPEVLVVVLGESTCGDRWTWCQQQQGRDAETWRDAGAVFERDLQRQRWELGTAVSRGMGRLEAAASRGKTGDAAAGTGRRGSDGQGRRRGARGRRGTRRDGLNLLLVALVDMGRGSRGRRRGAVEIRARRRREGAAATAAARGEVETVGGDEEKQEERRRGRRLVLEICPRGNNKMIIFIFPCS